VAGMIRSLKKFSDFIGDRARHIPAYGVVPQSTTLHHASENCIFSGFVISQTLIFTHSYLGRSNIAHLKQRVSTPSHI
jgi:hypothetical protein